jgi:hypothetical protein
MKKLTFPIWGLALLALLSLPAAARADSPPALHIRGMVTQVTADEITVKTSSGSVSVPIDDKTKVVGVVATTAAEITSGTFIGTANVPEATSTSTRALEVVVFPQSMAGTGEGDYPWDLPAPKGHSSMTNGTVEPRHAGSMMTNATVTGVNNGPSKTVILQYKGGSKSVTIPPGIPIVRVVPGSKSLLAAGVHVVAFPGEGGGASRVVIVGEGGIVPPM